MSDEWQTGGGEWDTPHAGSRDAENSVDNFNGFSPAPTAGRSGDKKCRNCGGDGHFARDCTEPRRVGACFNCGEEGHTKADCTKPRVFKGPCRICNREGHPAAECPEKPVDVCRNCKAEGHRTSECKENRKFDLNDVPDKLPEEAWAILKRASDERDLEEFREALKIYSKAVPSATFVDLESKMREDSFNIFLIALEKEVGDCLSLIDLQGKLGCKYVVGFYFSPSPHRANLKDRWPSTPEENLERLADAGFPYNRHIPKCSNCGEMGHSAKGCKVDRTTVERVEVKCVNCNVAGHRARNCPEKRRDQFACRNCGSLEHKATECTEPRSAEGVECKKCNEVGHFAKDCPKESSSRSCRKCGSGDHLARDCDKPRDVSNVTCRNCEAVGHYSRDCPMKKDWSKVQCNNCKEMGHTVKRCPKPVEADENTHFGGETSTGADVNAEVSHGPSAQW